MPDGQALPVAVDAMGGDKAPGEVVAGARAAADQGIPVVLVGPPEQVGDPLGLEVVACTEVIGMDEDPAQSVRKKKDASIVRAAELVRDGRAAAVVSAGNTGAAMAASLLRLGRIKGVIRPCIATPIPRPGATPVLLCDAGANAECTSEMLLQFARMAAAHATSRYGVAEPTVGLLSIGEEATKGTPLVKETHARLADRASGVRFYGNVEGRDLWRAGRRRRDGRVHRQRRAEDARGRVQVHVHDDRCGHRDRRADPRRGRRAADPPAADRRRPQPRHPRRRDPPRGGRRLGDLARVGVSAGGQSATGYGRLSGNSGQGSWSGRSSTSQCSGHWEAERRG